MIVTTDGRKRPKRVFKATGDVATRKPVVVLVDRGTASASEIVTAALQERLDAPVVGLRTFGKGVFGQIFDLSNDGALDLDRRQLLHTVRPQPERARASGPTCVRGDDSTPARRGAVARAWDARGRSKRSGAAPK